MFQPAMKLYCDSLPSWWEMECVRYGLSYAAVRHRLTAVMGSHVVRLTDHRYMTQLASRLQEDHEARQRARIATRKLRPITIVPELRGLLSRKMLVPRETSRRARRCATKFYTDAMKKCKQLPRLLLTDESEYPSEIPAL